MCAPRGVPTTVRWKGSSRHHLRVGDHHCFITHHTFSTGSIIFMINNQLFLPLCGSSAAINGRGDANLERSKLWSQVPTPCTLHSQSPALWGQSGGDMARMSLVGYSLCFSSGWLPVRRSQLDSCTKPEITGRVHRGLDVLSRGQVSTSRCCRDVWLPRSLCGLILLYVQKSPAGENSTLGASQGLP